MPRMLSQKLLSILLACVTGIVIIHGNNQCENGGSQQQGVHPKCKCPSGFKGFDCSQRVTPCEGRPCRNHGICMEHNETFTCTCTKFYKGVLCEEKGTVKSTKIPRLCVLILCPTQTTIPPSTAVTPTTTPPTSTSSTSSPATTKAPPPPLLTTPLPITTSVPTLPPTINPVTPTTTNPPPQTTSSPPQTTISPPQTTNPPSHTTTLPPQTTTPQPQTTNPPPTTTPEPGQVSCALSLKKMGCYKDDQKKPRPLPEYILTDRDSSLTKIYSGIEIDWGNWINYLPDFVCRCANVAKSKGYKFFGIQYYGECWSGPSKDENVFKEDGTSTECVDTKWKTPCDDQSKMACAGKEFNNYVYAIE